MRTNCRALEDLDDDHVTTATRGTCLEGYARELLVVVTVILLDLPVGSCRWRHLQKLAAQGELLRAAAIGKEAVMANSLEAFGENMKQEPTDKLLGGERHGLALAAVAIVFPAKLNLPIFKVEQPIVGDGNAVGVACDVPEDLFRSGKRWFGVDPPVCLPGRSDVAQERTSHSKWLQGGEEQQFSSVECLLQIIEEQSTEQAGQHANG